VSGEGRLPDGLGGGLARYGWPDEDVLACRVWGTGRPLIAVGLLPHANEPLGSAFAGSLEGYRDGFGSIALVGPIDPPPPSYRFPLPCDPVTFARRGYLQRTRDQVEFAHCAEPSTPAQRRAAELRACIGALSADALVLVHNDPRARAPYLYANRAWPEVERHLREDVGAWFPDWGPPPAGWTRLIGECTYSFFPCDRIGVTGTESAGIYLERELGIPTLTVELPMFSWGVAEEARQGFGDVLSRWISAGGVDSCDRAGMVRQITRLLAGQRVTMVRPSVSSRVVWAVLAGLQENLAAGRAPWPSRTYQGAGEEIRHVAHAL
jgi:hypothetical protein